MTLVGVCGIVRNMRGQVLLIRTAKVGWELPGGRIEANEAPHAALHREVLEETGYTLDAITRITGLYAHTQGDALLVVFDATVSETQVPARVDDEDSLEVAWFAPDEALERVTHPSEHDRLADALATPGELAYRIYS